MQRRWRRLLFIVASLALGLLTITYLHRPTSPVISEYENLLANDEHARQICKTNKLPLSKDRESRKVYDLFLVDTELDLLEIRLHTLDPVVDYFVIVESRQTFTRNTKPLHVTDNIDRFARFKDKIILRVIDFDSIDSDSPWDFESYSRNALYTHVFPILPAAQRARDGDILLVSDIDEIPRPSAITLLKTCFFPARTTLESAFYYYSFQWRHLGKRWLHPQATTYQDTSASNATILPQDLRTSAAAHPYRVIYDAAWHCSSCFSTIAAFQSKLRSFSHTEFNHPLFLDPAQIVRRVRNGIDLAERPLETYERVEENKDVPDYLRQEEARQKFQYLLDRDAPNAAFQDWKGEGAKTLGEWAGEWPDVWPQ